MCYNAHLSKINEVVVQKYKCILIVGKGIPIIPSIREMYEQPGYLIIGGKEEGFAYADFEGLHLKVDENTRIDIKAFGSLLNGKHMIDQSDYTYATRDVLKALDFYSGHNKLHVHLWSSYSGEASQDAAVLAIGSALVTHSPEDQNALEDLSNAALLKIKPYFDSYFETFAQEFISNSIQTSGFNYVARKDEVALFEVAPKLNDVLQDSSQVAIRIQNEFFQFANQNNVSVTNFPFGVLELKDFTIGYFIYNCFLGGPEVTKLYTATIEIRNKISSIVNSKLFGSAVTALSVATQSEHPKVVKMLIDYGADVKLTKDNGATALYIAAEIGNLEITKIFLDKRVDPNLVMNDGSNSLHAAANGGYTEVVKLLIGHHAKVNSIDNFKCTPLYYSAKNGHKDVVSVLLKHKADPNLDDDMGLSPLLLATQNGHVEISQMLVKNGADTINPIVLTACIKHDATTEALLALDHSKQNILMSTSAIYKICKNEIGKHIKLVKEKFSEHVHDVNFVEFLEVLEEMSAQPRHDEF